MKSLRAFLLIIVVLVMSDLLSAQQTDTTGLSRSVAVKVNQGISFPDVATRLMIVGAGVLVLGGMAFLLNAKRKQLDREAGIE